MAGINQHLQSVAPLKRTAVLVWMCVLLGLVYWVAMMGLYAFIAAVSDQVVFVVRHGQIAGLMAAAGATGFAVPAVRTSGAGWAWLLLGGMMVTTVVLFATVAGIGAIGLAVLFGCMGVARGTLLRAIHSGRGWLYHHAEAIYAGLLVIELALATLVLSTRERWHDVPVLTSS